MTTATTATDRTTTRRSPARIALWVLQVLLGLFLAVASGLPKLFGEPTAVAMFEQMGAPWLRPIVGVLEVAGGIGLMVPLVAGLAAACFVALMAGATITTFAALDTTYWYTPVIIGLLCLGIAVVRRHEITALFRR
jgi:putative oxidoreductase